MPRFLIIGPAMTILLATKTYACSCEESNSIAENVRMASTVFSGTVLAQKKVKTKGFEWRVYTIELDKLFKGRIKDKTISVWTAATSAACGIALDSRQKIVIYGYNNYNSVKNDLDTKRDFIYTNLCTRSGTYARSEEKGILVALNKK